MAKLRASVIRLSDQLTLFCRPLLHDLASRNYIRSHITRSQRQECITRIAHTSMADATFSWTILGRVIDGVGCYPEQLAGSLVDQALNQTSWTDREHTLVERNDSPNFVLL